MIIKPKKTYEIVIDSAVEILKQYSNGVDYGTLIGRISSDLPEIPINTVHGTFAMYFKNFPKNVQKPRRGFYIWAEDTIHANNLSNPSNPSNETIDTQLKEFINIINGFLVSIKIKRFQQFSDLEIDLTIPKGEKNAGLPLKKICIIGQSGTGKTTLLNLIRYFAFSRQSKKVFPVLEIDPNAEIELIYQTFPIDNEKDKSIKVSLKYSADSIEAKTLENNVDISILENYFRDIENRLFYFPSDIIKKLDTKEAKDDSVLFESILEDKIFDFSLLTSSYIWDTISQDIDLYKSEYANQAIILANNSSSGFERALIAFNQWKQEHPNPIEELATDCLDEILKEFGVKVKTQLEKLQDTKFITLETHNGVALKTHHWSTGTKHVISCVLPMYTFKPKNAIILFDEPENSLYPNIQNKIVELYSRYADNSQLFFATHSPIIASSFEPYEVIELIFDDECKSVSQELYYKGGRHIENYFLFPKYLTWGGILEDVFNVDVNSNEERGKKLDELAEIDEEIKILVKASKKEDAKLRQKDFEKIAGLLKWNLT